MHTLKNLERWGRGGGQVVSVLTFYSNDPSSNPAEVYNVSVKLLLKRTKINKKTLTWASIQKRERETNLEIQERIDL